MYNFLEENIRNKIEIAYLLFSEKEISNKKKLAEKLHISKATAYKYIDEVEGKYLDITKRDDISDSNYYLLYTSNNYKKVYNLLLKESIKLALLKEIIFDPGHNALFYQEKIGISEASFARYIVSIKYNLNKYDAYIDTKNGYKIQGKDRLCLVSLIAAMTFAFNFTIKESMLDEFLDENSLEPDFKVIQDKVNKYLDKYMLNHYTYEKRFYNAVLYIYVFMKYVDNLNTDIDYKFDLESEIECLVDELKIHYNRADKLVELKRDDIAKVVINSNENNDLEKIIRLLKSIVFNINVFPHSIYMFPIRHTMFINAYEKHMTKNSANIKNIINYFSELLNVDLNKRYIIMAYVLIIQDLHYIKFINNIYLYTDFNMEHVEFIEKK